jgi:type IV pilus assembly protein PilZ
MRENRQFQRASAVIKVNYQSQGALKMDYAQNISRGGLFLATNSAFQVGQQIELQLSTKGNTQVIGVPGLVRWVGERGTPPVKGIGVQFQLEDSLVRSRIENMINALEEPQLHQENDLQIFILEPTEFIAKMYADGIIKMSNLDENAHLQGAVKIKIFSKAADAFDAIKKGACHIFITELKSDEIDGVALIKKIRSELTQEMPIFAIAKSYEGDRQEAIQAGATAFLNKPVQMKTLFNTLLLCVQDLKSE